MVMREKKAFSGSGQAERSYFGEAQMIFSHAKVAKPTSNTNLIRNKTWQVCRETNIYQLYCDRRHLHIFLVCMLLSEKEIKVYLHCQRGSEGGVVINPSTRTWQCRRPGAVGDVG